MSEDIPQVRVEPVRRSIWSRVSVVWLVPIAALAIALGVAWQSFVSQGPVITVLFDEAAGVHARETELRFRDVTVGLVERVAFTDGLDRVAVTIRLDKDIAPFVDDEARFWVVTPEVSAQGVTGLDTVLSGVYIQGLWDSVAGAATSEFVGLEDTPLARGGEEGLRIRLSASSDALTGNSVLTYRGVEVGRVGPSDVTLDGQRVQAEAVIFAPYDSLVTEATRFWNTSGFTVSLGTGGAEIDFESLASLIGGGMTFDTFVSGAALARDGAEFEVFEDLETARSSVFARGDGPPLLLSAVFDGNVAGLSTGSVVELEGLRIGEVQALNGIIIGDETGAEDVRLQVILAIRPERLGIEGAGARNAALSFFEGEVAQGLRARLATGNLLTGGLKVQLIKVDAVPPGRFEMEAAPYPRLPVTENAVSDVSTTAQEALDRFNELPIEEILTSTQALIDNAAVFMGNQDTQALPGAVRGVIDDVREVTASDALQGVPDQIGTVLAELQGSVTELNALLAEVREAGLVTGATEALEAVETAVAGVPALVDELTALTAEAGTLALDELVAGAVAVTETADGILSDLAASELIGQAGTLVTELETAVNEIGALVSEVSEAGGAARLNNALAAAEAAALSLDEALAGVPGAVEQVGAAAEGIAALELQPLVDRLASLTAEAEALLANPDVQDLPAELNDALAELTDILAAFRQGGAVENTNTALSAIARAADDFGGAVSDLPGLITQAEGVLRQAGSAIAGFDENAAAMRDLRAALRGVAEAADAVSRLARTLERNPSSLILGR